MTTRIVLPFQRFGVLLVVVGGMSSAACSNEDRGDGDGFSGGEAGSVPPCPTESIECPDSGPPPGYSEDVEPILAAHCTGCHGPGGENADVPLTSYTLVSKNRTAISNVLGCKMPPPPLPRLSDVERATFYCWYAGGRHQ